MGHERGARWPCTASAPTTPPKGAGGWVKKEDKLGATARVKVATEGTRQIQQRPKLVLLPSRRLTCTKRCSTCGPAQSEDMVSSSTNPLGGEPLKLDKLQVLKVEICLISLAPHGKRERCAMAMHSIRTNNTP